MSTSGNAERDFTLSGRRFRKARRDFIDAVRGQRPKSLQTWAVRVGDTLYPPKQIVALATGFNDFTTHQANAVLRRFGFESFALDRDEARAATSPGEFGGGLRSDIDLRSPDLRRAALRGAIDLAARRPDSTVDEVLEMAESFERWLRR